MLKHKKERCKIEDIPAIVSKIYQVEHAYPMTFITESFQAKVYMVGMTMTRGRLVVPGSYVAKDRKLLPQDVYTKKTN